MSTSTSTLTTPSPDDTGAINNHIVLSLLVLCWGVVILYLVVNGAFQDAPGTAPISIVYANGIPLGLFLLSYAFSSRLRAYVGTFSPSLLAGLHGMRTIGFSFLAYASIGQLPWLFAIPAGVGDIMVAVGAPFIAYLVATKPGFLRSKRFVLWNIFGIVDFLLAVGTGSAARILGPEVVGAGMEPMATLPLVMIPAFLVPMFMITHVIMLMRAFQERKKAA